MLCLLIIVLSRREETAQASEAICRVLPEGCTEQDLDRESNLMCRRSLIPLVRISVFCRLYRKQHMLTPRTWQSDNAAAAQVILSYMKDAKNKPNEGSSSNAPMPSPLKVPLAYQCSFCSSELAYCHM